MPLAAAKARRHGDAGASTAGGIEATRKAALGEALLEDQETGGGHRDVLAAAPPRSSAGRCSGRTRNG